MLRSALRWLVVALSGSLVGAAEGVHLMESLNDPLPAVLAALHAEADPVPARPSPPSRRVVVVLVDGLGAVPFDARVREGTLGLPAWTASLDSGIPSRSRPVYHAILTGVPQWAAGIRANGYARQRADSVPDRVRAGGGKVAWMLENEPWFCELFCARDDIVVEGPSVTSAETFARVWDGGPDLLVVHLLDVDEAGHLHGADSVEYTDASRRVFALVAAFRAVARAKPGGDGAIWFVGADHGHTPHGGHGGPEAIVREVTWVALAGGEERPRASALAVGGGVAAVTSLAPTIARALGVDPPRESMADGLALGPALPGPPFIARRARIAAAEEARAAHATRLLGNPVSRGALIVGVLVATLAGLVGVRRRRGVAEATVFVVAAAGFFIAGPGLSMSAVRTETWYLAHALATLTVFAAAAWGLARRRASATVVAGTCLVFPLLALAAMRGSLGVSDASPIETVLWPSLGLVPASVCAAMALVEAGVAIRARLRGRRAPPEGVKIAV